MVALAGIIRATIAAITQNAPGDPDCRALMSVDWACHPHLLRYGVWLPLHFYSIGLIYYLVGNPLIAGKLLSVITGTLTVIPLYNISTRLFGRKVALFTGLLLSILGMHVALSSLTMSEAPFALFALLAADIMLEQSLCKKPTARRVLLAAFLLAIGGGFRHEAWLMTGIFSIWMLFSSKMRKFVIPYAVIGLLPFVLWGAMNYTAGYGFLYPLSGIDTIKKSELAGRTPLNILHIVHRWAVSFTKDPGPFVFMASIVGMWLAVKRRLNINMVALAIAMLLPLAYKSFTTPGWDPRDRYVIIPALLLLPYAAYAVYGITKCTKKQTWIAAALIILTLGMQEADYSRHSKLCLPIRDRNPDEMQVSKFLSTEIKQNDRLLCVNNYQLQAYGIILRSGGYRSFKVLELENDDFSAGGKKAASEFHPTLVVVQKEYHPSTELIGHSARNIYSSGVYQVFRIPQSGS